MMMGNQNPNVFTAAQWEELEQQALIYKYMVSGVPVPSDLILSVRRSLYNSSSSSLSNQPNLGAWEGGFPYNHLYQIGGYGRKIDLEPGRCRRTDGKKWRCSKEAYPDSKYCERHMHRGRNRSRKPVEFPPPSPTSSTAVSKSISQISDPYPPLSSIHTNFMGGSSSYSHHQSLKDYRNLQPGMKDLREDDQRSAYFQLNDPYTTTQKMSSHHHNYSHFNFENLKDQQEKQEGGQHCFVMGTDFIKPSSSSSSEATKSSIPMALKVDESTSKQPFHHFFSPPKTTLNPNHDPNWVDHHQQVMIDPPKAPLSTQDLFQSKPRPCW
ncbi:hypothetical protein R6Q59_033676 [Mikania micrantha]|uniref:Growth-regulating factor n=1 Tax=Mikania micrantha TaxID=192012 RepID=A0A5N6NMS8_9ASTR|nr:hypothetical protein E3N88_21480 [Mikania micrantha]